MVAKSLCDPIMPEETTGSTWNSRSHESTMPPVYGLARMRCIGLLCLNDPRVTVLPLSVEADETWASGYEVGSTVRVVRRR